ncbi:TPA: hypothetical protein N0F65_000658 [Lagenidium giganteum]|uniref:Uncharacterized protein n=1 Tax=Lagenidium giganteum TaxID=4803 RepID=A0AAV2YM88_9STRA|nr:TPA: hypothetical protein N0F65_000658 [Lagenidium giganteum]
MRSALDAVALSTAAAAVSLLATLAASWCVHYTLTIVNDQRKKGPGMNEVRPQKHQHKRTEQLSQLPASSVPRAFQLDAYFAPEHMRAFAHAKIFDGCANVFAVIDAIHPYLVRFFDDPAVWSAGTMMITAAASPDQELQYPPQFIDPEFSAKIVVHDHVNLATLVLDKVVNTPTKRWNGTHGVVIQEGAVVLGGTFDVSDGAIQIGRNVRVEPNVFIKGPCIIGDNCTLRSGAYIRGDVIVGRSVVLRGELKNVLIMDQAELCHPGYCGDSVCGFKSHMGNQVTTANLNLFSFLALPTLKMEVDGVVYDSGRTKTGVILGDYCQLGCSSVTDPSTLIMRNTLIYPLSRLPKGIYGPNQIIKNKPLENGVIEIAALRT